MNVILKCHDTINIKIVRGENCYLYDDEGKQYTDLESGIWCTALGHCHPRTIGAIEAQIGNLVHLGTRYPHFLAQEAAKDILKVVGIDNGKCIFLSSGSEAVEFSVQTARRITEKPLLLSFSNSYLAAYGSAGTKNPDEWQLVDWSVCNHTNQCDCLDNIPFHHVGGFIF